MSTNRRSLASYLTRVRAGGKHFSSAVPNERFLRRLSEPYVGNGELAESGVPVMTDYWDILRRHIWVLIGVACLGVLGGVLFSLSRVPTYTAHALIEIQGLNDNFLNVKDVTPVAEWPFTNIIDDVQTQIKIISSRTLLERVITRLTILEPADLGKNTGRRNIWAKPPDFGKRGSAEAREMALVFAGNNLFVRAVGRTRMVEILYEGTDPELTAKFVNAVATEFIAYNIEMRLKTSQQTSEWINGQLEELRKKLATSEEALKDYARRSGLVILSETTNVSEDKLRRLQEELTRAQADRILKQARYELVNRASPEHIDDVLNDDLLKDHQSKLATLRQQQAELSTAYTPEYGKLKKVTAQIASLESSLQQRRSALVEQIRNQYREAVGREKLLVTNYATETRSLAQEGAKTVEYGMLKRDLDSNRQLYDAMLQRTKAAGVLSDMRASNARIIDTAVLPRQPSGPHMAIHTALGFTASLLVGLVLVTIRERRDHSIRRPGELRTYLNAGELGVIQSAGKRNRLSLYGRRPRTLDVSPAVADTGGPLSSMAEIRNRQPVDVIVSPQEHSVLAHSFRSVLTSLCVSGATGRQPRVLVITSPNASDGKTTIASNLAITLAAIHGRVLLIDADVHRPRLHEIFGVSNENGFTDLLTPNNKSIGEQLLASVQDTGTPGLFLLPAGTNRGHRLYQTDSLMRFMKEARNRFDTVVIDTPPMLELADARVLGRSADGVVLVARAGATTRQAAIAANQRLADDGIHLLGTILNDWDPKSSRGGYYCY